MKNPSFRWITEGRTDFVQSDAGDEASFFPKFCELRIAQILSAAFGRYPGTPKDFIGHPITDAGETFLQEERAFDRKAAMAF